MWRIRGIRLDCQGRIGSVSREVRTERRNANTERVHAHRTLQRHLVRLGNEPRNIPWIVRLRNARSHSIPFLRLIFPAFHLTDN